MFKILRRYSKWILAIGGTLLMITFLIPQAIQTLSQRAALGSAVWATVGENDEELRTNILEQCRIELQMFEDLGQPIAGFGILRDPAHWYLLVREAEQAGLVGGLATDALPIEQIGPVIAATGRPVRADKGLGKLLSVTRMFFMYQSASKLSDHRLRHLAERRFHDVEARFVVLSADARDDAPMPDESAITAQFEAFRDVEPGEGERGFGYRRPDRFKIEWITVPADSIREMVEQSDALNGVALAKHWRLHQTGRSFPEIEEGAEVPQVVRDDLVKDLTEASRQQIQKFVRNRLLETWRRLPVREGLHVLPDDWDEQRVDFGSLARDLQVEYPGLPLPAYEAIGDRWLTVEDLGEIEGLGASTTDKVGTITQRITTLVAATREFGGDDVIMMQQGVTGPMMLDAATRDIYYFRITDTDPARAARDVDEVRPEIVRDLKRKADFERLLAEKGSIELAAREYGLLALAMERGTEVQPRTNVHLDSTSLLAFQLQNNFQINRLSPLPIIGPDEETVAKIVDHAMAFPLDQALAFRGPEDRIFVLPVDDQMSLLVVELLTQSPLSLEQFAQVADVGLDGLLIGEEMEDSSFTIVDVFNFEALAERHNFKYTRTAPAEGNGDAEVEEVADAGEG